MHFVELKLCEKIGSVLEECNRLVDDSLLLLRTWLASETYDRILDGDVSLFSQAKSYIIRTFMEEGKKQFEAGKSDRMFSDDALFWIGYLITYWCLEYQESAKNIMNNYDLENMLYSYETLHTISVKAAIDKIKEDYCNG